MERKSLNNVAKVEPLLTEYNIATDSAARHLLPINITPQLNLQTDKVEAQKHFSGLGEYRPAKELPDPDNSLISEQIEQEVIEAHSRKELEEYIAFRPSVIPADGQPELHERQKTVCMKLFHKLADKTDLNVQELQTYYRIRLSYVEPFDLSNPKHEVSVSKQFLTVFYRPCSHN